MKAARPNIKTNTPPSAPSASPTAWLLAILFLTVATAAALMLSLKHIWSIELIGCGQGGGCDEVIRGKWGTIAGWPVAFVGLAYFAGWLIFCLLTRRSTLPSWLRFVAGFGCLVSLGYIGLMVADSHYCVWCLTSHAANLAFSVAFFTGFRFASSPLPRTAASAAILIGIVLLSAVKVTYGMQKQTVTTREAAKAAESIAQIAAPTEQSKRFGGRFWTGAVNADVRIVVYHDFQCELCHEAELKIRALLDSRVDVALSFKQWPLDADCNEHMNGTSIHPGSCLAAKAVEAAGVVGGPSAYWTMHALLSQGRKVTPEFITSVVAQAGIDQSKFMQVYQSPQIDSLIQADIAEGMTYGLAYTPLIFVNGYPLRGWQTVNALPDAITRAAMFAKQQPKQSDLPDSAAYEQAIIWRSSQPTALPKDHRAPLLGPADAPTTITVFGDLTCPYNAAAMAILKPLVESRHDTKLLFYNFPLDRDCNPLLDRQINQFACEASRVVEAIRLQKGDDAYRQAALWVIANQSRIGAPAMAELGSQFGYDAAGVAKLLSLPTAEAAVKADMDRCVALKINSSPTIYINDKPVPNWRTPGLFPKILDLAQPRL